MGKLSRGASARIQIDPTGADGELWELVAELAEMLDDPWVLVGGLMVHLFVLEHEPQRQLRATDDIDLLADSRKKPSRTERISQKLLEDGFELKKITYGPPPTGFTFWKGGKPVDVLAPDGTKTDAKTVGNLHTVQIPGGTQALRRAEEVEIRLTGGPTFRLQRPTLLGAVLIKARALPVHDDPEAQRHDLVQLLSLIKDPGAVARELKPGERRWLKSIEGKLWPDIDADTTLARLDETAVRRAREAYDLLVG